MVLVTDLVAPATEAATGPDVLGLEAGQDLSEGTLTLEGGGGVTVVEAAVVGRDDLVGGLEHLSVDQTLDGVGQKGLLVDRLHRGLGNLQHDRPVRALLSIGALGLGAVGKLDGGELLGSLGLVVRGVVGEDGGTVEGAVVLGEVELLKSFVSFLSGTFTYKTKATYPALVTDSLGASTTDTNTNNVGGGVEELLGEAVQLLVTHVLGKEVHGHGGDQLLVADGGAVRKLDGLAGGVDLGDLALLTEASVLLGDGVGNGDPDATGTTVGGETESSVGTPVTGSLVQDDVGGDSLDVGSGNTLTEPGTLHLQIGITRQPSRSPDNGRTRKGYIQALPWWWAQPRPCSCRVS